MDRFLGLVKLFVIVSGILIIAGTVALIWLLISREEPNSPVEHVIVEAPPMAGPPSESPQPPADLEADLEVPAGSVVIDMQMAGGTALLLLRTVEGQEYLAVVDLSSGKRRSLLRLVPAPP